MCQVRPVHKPQLFWFYMEIGTWLEVSLLVSKVTMVVKLPRRLNRMPSDHSWPPWFMTSIGRTGPTVCYTYQYYTLCPVFVTFFLIPIPNLLHKRNSVFCMVLSVFLHNFWKQCRFYNFNISTFSRSIYWWNIHFAFRQKSLKIHGP